jgi:MFS family permease
VPGGPAFSQTAYLIFVVITFGADVVADPTWGRIGDRFGRRKTLIFAGGLGCAVTTLLVYFVPLAAPRSFVLLAIVGVLYGITLAGYVPLSALVTSIVPDHEQGNAIAVYSLAAGLSTVLGPLVYLAASPLLDTLGVMLVFAALYVVSTVTTYRVRDAADPGENLPARGEPAAAS